MNREEVLELTESYDLFFEEIDGDYYIYICQGHRYRLTDSWIYFQKSYKRGPWKNFKGAELKNVKRCKGDFIDGLQPMK